jgi:hypothetical protein
MDPKAEVMGWIDIGLTKVVRRRGEASALLPGEQTQTG